MRRQLARVLSALDSFPKPTLARVNGDGYGGALGLIAACDIVVAVDSAKFAFTEVRLGIIPAVVSPFVLGKIGESAALRYFLTAETMSAATLKEIGLAHEAVPAERLDATCGGIIDAILKGAPGAQAAAKALIRDAPADRRPTRRCRDGHGSATCQIEGAGGSPRRICGILCQAQSQLAARLARKKRGGRPCPCHAQIPWPSWKTASVACQHGSPHWVRRQPQANTLMACPPGERLPG